MPRIRLLLAATSLALCTGTGLALSGATAADAAFPGTNGFIVFSTNNGINGNYVLSLAQVDSGGVSFSPETNTANHNDFSPVFSSNGRRIVFVRDDDIWYLDYFGHAHQLTSTGATDADPTYTPDGRIIWYAGSTGTLHLMNGDGSHKTDLGLAGARPSVSPNGRWVVYTHYVKSTGADHIFKAHLDGTHRTDLTPGATLLQQNADWSPGGGHLVYQRVRSSGGPFEIAVMRPDGSHQHAIALNPSADAIDPAYSPDGTLIVFSFEFDSTSAELYEISPDGTGGMVLGNSSKHNITPNWQPT